MAAVPPTLAGFTDFLEDTVGIPSDVMPSAGLIAMAFAVALSIVNPALQSAVIPSTDNAGATLNSGNMTIYALAVYNLGTDNVFNYAQDAVDAPIYKDGLAYWAYFQQKYQINAFVSGVITSASDQGTGDSLVVQDAARDFTLMNLQQLKTPWGRTYLGFAQSYGQVWGLS
jgi:hypothetical protein